MGMVVGEIRAFFSRYTYIGDGGRRVMLVTRVVCNRRLREGRLIWTKGSRDHWLDNGDAVVRESGALRAVRTGEQIVPRWQSAE